MQELRFVAVSEDGSYAVLAVPGRSARFTLPIDERLRAVALGQTSRLAQYEIEVESPLRPKEIQARIRAGETAEEIADAAGLSRSSACAGSKDRSSPSAPTSRARRSRRRCGARATPRPVPGSGTSCPSGSPVLGSDPEDAQWDSTQARRRQLAGLAHVHLRRPPACRRVGVRPAPQARRARPTRQPSGFASPKPSCRHWPRAFRVRPRSRLWPRASARSQAAG